MEDIKESYLISRIETMMANNTKELADSKKELAESQRDNMKWIIGFALTSIAVAVGVSGLLVKFLIQ